MFYAASVGSLLIRLIPNFSGQDPLELFSTSFTSLKLLDTDNSSMENSRQVFIFILLCVLLGLVCGIVAGLFNQWVAAVMRIRLRALQDPERKREKQLGTTHTCRRCRGKDDWRRNLMSIGNFSKFRVPIVIGTVLVEVVAFGSGFRWMPFMNSSSKTIEHLFGKTAADYAMVNADDYGYAWLPLLFLLIWRFATVPIALSLPLPSGLFMYVLLLLLMLYCMMMSRCYTYMIMTCRTGCYTRIYQLTILNNDLLGPFL